MSKTAYIGVDNLSRKVKTMYVGVDGVARKVKKAYIGVDGVAKEWYSSGKKLSEYGVGDIVLLPENGVNAEYIIVHQGLPSSMYDASCDGTWLLRKDAYTKGAWGSSSANDYSASSVNTYLKNTYLPKIGSSVKSVMKTAKIPYVSGSGTAGVVKSGSEGLSAMVFLLSAYEIGFTTDTDSTLRVDGAILDYFKNDGQKYCYYDGALVEWWTRSPSKTSSNYVQVVTKSGDLVPGSPSAFKYGVRPAFIINSDTMFDSSTNIIL